MSLSHSADIVHKRVGDGPDVEFINVEVAFGSQWMAPGVDQGCWQPEARGKGSVKAQLSPMDFAKVKIV